MTPKKMNNILRYIQTMASSPIDKYLIFVGQYARIMYDANNTSDKQKYTKIFGEYDGLIQYTFHIDKKGYQAFIFPNQCSVKTEQLKNKMMEKPNVIVIVMDDSCYCTFNLLGKKKMVDMRFVSNYMRTSLVKVLSEPPNYVEVTL
jgi:hypothetical protein